MYTLRPARPWVVLFGSFPVGLLILLVGGPRFLVRAASPAAPGTPACFTQAPSPNPGAGVNTLNSVSTLPSGEAWAVGSYANGAPNQPLTLHWDGLNWQVTPSPNLPGGTLNGVSALA